MVPPRSRLYNLEPVGIRTPYVESLCGYVARLAYKHSTTLHYLFSREVAPLINKPGTICHRVSFASFAKAVNGVGVTAADLVDVFEKLTLRKDLTYTTMLPWAKAISSKSLTRETRAWCPACYEDCAASKSEVYDQLLWGIQSVTACVKHKLLLEHKCSYCNQSQPLLSHRSRPGFCSRCRGWLGSKLSAGTQVNIFSSNQPIKEEIKIAEEVGKLLTVASNYASSGVAANFTEHLWVYVKTMFMGRGRPSQIELPVNKQTIRCWLKGSQRPSLSLLLKTCLALDISPVDLLTKNIRDKSKRSIDVITHEYLPTHRETAIDEIKPTNTLINWKDSKSVAAVERRLGAAREENPPSSLTQIAKELKCTRQTLRKKFPDLATQVAERADAYYRPSISTEKLLHALQDALKEKPPPALQEVSRRLGKGASTSTLYNKFPKESRRISERYCAQNKRRLDDRSIEKKLRMFLKVVPPRSMPEVSREVGVARSTLLSKFPELYKEISKLFAFYRREKDVRNRERARAEIRTICEQALREGLYPGDALVRSRLSTPCQSEALSKIRRQVLVELGCAILL